MTLKILDLFAGAGGLSLGFELARDTDENKVFELYKAVDIDKYACRTLRKRYGEKKVIEGDITKMEISRRIIETCKGKVQIVLGGIPCQSFSLIGPRSGLGIKMAKFKNDERDKLYEHFRYIVDEIKPNVIVIENVKGILSKKDNHGRKIIDKIISDFEDVGYNFNNYDGKKWQLLNAADFGVPQRRERIVIIGIKKSWKGCNVPCVKPTHFNQSLPDAEKKLSEGLMPYVSVFEATGDLPEVKSKITFTGLDEKEKKKISEENERIDSGKDRIEFDRALFQMHLNKVSLSGADFLHFVRPNGYEYIDHHVARCHQISDIELFKNMKQGETADDFIKRNPEKARKLIKYCMLSFKDKYRKQKGNETSTTVFAHLEKDGNRFIHPAQARTYTPREAARIQSFPDDITFEGPMSKKFRQIGNAVPPRLSFNIANTIYFGVMK